MATSGIGSVSSCGGIDGLGNVGTFCLGGDTGRSSIMCKGSCKKNKLTGLHCKSLILVHRV